MAIIINGRKIANRIIKELSSEIKNAKCPIKLAILQIGNHPSSSIYLNAQMKLAEKLGIKYYVKNLKRNTSQKKAEMELDKLSRDKSITGIIVETPLPKQIDVKKLFAKISPRKDVEGVNPVNIGKLIYENWIVAPCTASACMKLIDSTGVKLRGKELVIVGHSEIVGRPLALMLLSKMATVTVCHIGTYEKGLLKKHVEGAEILIVSVGKAHLIKGSWIKKGAIVIDVGINKYKGSITGDVDFENAKKKASYITPVPGGVGPLTLAMLMKNLIALYKSAKIRG